MRTLRDVPSLRAALAEHRRRGRRIGLVPTMGALHEGHLSLIRRAGADCDCVVVSLFVNPTQFDDQRDLAAYPREEARDAELAAQAGADLLFAPPPENVYPPGFSTTVSVAGLTESLEGAVRGRAHFDGVATVVAKLLAMSGPDAAYFGEKDAQQLAVVRRLVADLDLDVSIVGCPTVREPDGLAMSSRNLRLSPEERVRAASLHRALGAAAAVVASGELDGERIRAAGRDALDSAVELEYLEIVDPITFAPVSRVERSARILIAARVGATRLIDNELVAVPPRGASGGPPALTNPVLTPRSREEADCA